MTRSSRKYTTGWRDLIGFVMRYSSLDYLYLEFIFFQGTSQVWLNTVLYLVKECYKYDLIRYCTFPMDFILYYTTVLYSSNLILYCIYLSNFTSITQHCIECVQGVLQVWIKTVLYVSKELYKYDLTLCCTFPMDFTPYYTNFTSVIQHCTVSNCPSNFISMTQHCIVLHLVTLQVWLYTV